MKKTIPSIKVNVNTIDNMNQAIKKYNEKNLMKMNFSNFRRLSYELLSQMILLNMNIPIELLPK